MGQLLTFQDQYQMVQDLTHFNSVPITSGFKRNINTGCSKLMAAMDRAFWRRSRFTDLVASQVYYSFPKDALKMMTVMTHIGGVERDLDEITDEKYWNQLNQIPNTGIPMLYFVKGMEEVGIYPSSGSLVSAGAELVFQQRHVNMTQDDYTTGTVATQNGLETLVGTNTNWTQEMVGWGFEVTDGSDGNWYRVQSVEGAHNLTLDGVFQGVGGSAAPYRLGQTAVIPEEFLEAPADYAGMKFYQGRDQTKFTQYETLWTGAIEEIRSQYSRKTASNLISASHEYPTYDSLRSNISINT